VQLRTVSMVEAMLPNAGPMKPDLLTCSHKESISLMLRQHDTWATQQGTAVAWNGTLALPDSVDQRAISPSTSRSSTATLEVPWLQSYPSDGLQISTVSTLSYLPDGHHRHLACHSRTATSCASDDACTPRPISPATSRCSTVTLEVPWLQSYPTDGHSSQSSRISTPSYLPDGRHRYLSHYLKTASSCASNGECTPHSPRMDLAMDLKIDLNLRSVCLKLQEFIDQRLQDTNRQRPSSDADLGRRRSPTRGSNQTKTVEPHEDLLAPGWFS